MLIRRSWRILFPVTAAALLPAALLLAAAVPAQAGSQSGWRIAKVIGPADANSAMVSIAASGRNDAWAAGDTFAPCPGACSPSLLVEHWNGRAWAAQPLPRTLRRRFGSLGVTALGAASGKDAWVFGRPNTGFTASALHWTGRAWTTSSFPHLTGINEAAVFGARDAWAFGDRYNARFTARKIYAARYNGKAWRQVWMPGAPTSLTVLSATDMWAVGISAATFGNPQGIPAYIGMHWNGHRWQTYPLPTLGLTAPVFLDAASSAATGPKSLWVEYGPDELAQPGSSRAGGRADQPPATGLLHWNGASWSEIALPFSAFPSGPMAADGHGGLWIFQSAGNPSPGPYLYHYSHRTWTSQALPVPVTDHGLILAMTQAPGTASLWAAGSLGLDRPVGHQAVIFRYGR
jgi:hypothetical protein